MKYNLGEEKYHLLRQQMLHSLMEKDPTKTFLEIAYNKVKIFAWNQAEKDMFADDFFKSQSIPLVQGETSLTKADVANMAFNRLIEDSEKFEGKKVQRSLTGADIANYEKLIDKDREKLRECGLSKEDLIAMTYLGHVVKDRENFTDSEEPAAGEPTL